MREFERGKETYRLAEVKGLRVLWQFVRPLPPKKSEKSYNWEIEHKRLAEELWAKGIDYDMNFDFESLPTLGKVKALIAKYHNILESLSPAEFVAKVREPISEKWSERHLLSEIGDMDITKEIPNRLKRIGTVAYAFLPEAREVYPAKLGDATLHAKKQMNLYQCTCGRYIAVPMSLGRPVRGYNSCGCICTLYNKNAARTKRQRVLDAFREWTTMKLACFDERCLHFKPENTFNMRSFAEFFKWYDRQVKNKSLDDRFVARIDKSLPFEMGNLKIVNRVLDKTRQRGYIDI